MSIHALVAKIWPDKVVRWCRNGDYLHPVFAASRVQGTSDLHSKFALRPHQEKKKEEERRKKKKEKKKEERKKKEEETG